MDSALVVSALLMGLAGGPHCAAMCGAAQAGLTGSGGPSRAASDLLVLQAGRLLGYAVGGAVVAASVASFGALQAAAPWLRPLWTLVHVAAIALGLWLLWHGAAPAWLSRFGRRAPATAGAQPIRWVPRLGSTGRAGIVGACWIAMPCGLLQSALLVAALASGPLQGASVMAAFAVASGASLWLGPQLWRRLGRQTGADRAATVSVRLAGALLAGASLFALWHGLGAALEQALCSVVT
jgi:sulfite exporter TauE/SafE